MKNIEKRLSALETAILPGKPTLDFSFRCRMGGESDDAINIIANHLPGGDPEPWHEDWVKEPGETYAAFKDRTKAYVLNDLRPGSNGAIYYELSDPIKKEG